MWSIKKKKKNFNRCLFLQWVAYIEDCTLKAPLRWLHFLDAVAISASESNLYRHFFFISVCMIYDVTSLLSLLYRVVLFSHVKYAESMELFPFL